MTTQLKPPTALEEAAFADIETLHDAELRREAEEAERF